jgi:hypothetical protein
MWLAIGGVALYLYSQRSALPAMIPLPAQPVRTDTGIKVPVIPVNYGSPPVADPYGATGPQTGIMLPTCTPAQMTAIGANPFASVSLNCLPPANPNAMRMPMIGQFFYDANGNIIGTTN